MASIREKIAQAIAGRFWPQGGQDTTAGLAPGNSSIQWSYDVTSLPAQRYKVYDDMELMDRTMPEISRALDILADNAVNAPGGAKRSFHIRYDEAGFISKATQQIIEDCVGRTRLEEKIYPFCRETLKYGDLFIQNIVDEDLNVARLMFMDPYTMTRNEDSHGLLKTGTTEGECAFEQHERRDGKFLTAFYPWQIEHVRWNRSGMSKYGRPALESARYPFKKLQSMEEALVVNWLTRAFARLLFEVDTSGLPAMEAEKKLRQMKAALSSTSVGAQLEGAHRMTTVQDLYVSNSYVNNGGKWEKSLNNVSVLDTSNTGFWNIAAVEYWRTKLVTATGVPKAHLGIETEINAKATLQWEDERFARLVRRVQMAGSEIIHHAIDLDLMLKGIDPARVQYVVEWPSPVMHDDVEQAQVYAQLATAAADLLAGHVMTPDQIRDRLFDMTPAQRKEADAYYTTLEAKESKVEVNSDR